MKSPPRMPILEVLPAGMDLKLAWLIAVVALGLTLATAALALDLHNQKRRFESLSEHLRKTAALRDSEVESLTAENATRAGALRRLESLFSERESDLKKLSDAYTQREPLVKQATDVQQKLESLAKELLDLAKTDPDAREITRKYNIQQSTPSPSSTPPKP